MRLVNVKVLHFAELLKQTWQRQQQQPLLEYGSSHEAGLRQTIHTQHVFEVKTTSGTENCPVPME